MSLGLGVKVTLGRMPCALHIGISTGNWTNSCMVLVVQIGDIGNPLNPTWPPLLLHNGLPSNLGGGTSKKCMNYV